MAFLVVILRWPEGQQPQRYIVGSRSVGPMERAGAFRELPMPVLEMDVQAELLGQAAEEFVKEIESSRPSKFSEDIAEQSLEEVKGYADDPYTEDARDAKFGQGGWRPHDRKVERGRQRDDSWNLIDATW